MEGCIDGLMSEKRLRIAGKRDGRRKRGEVCAEVEKEAKRKEKG